MRNVLYSRSHALRGEGNPMRAIQSIHHSTMTLEDIEDSIISLQYHLEGEGESGDEKRALIRRLIARKNAIKGAVINREEA